jgi:hypothetical protein
VAQLVSNTSSIKPKEQPKTEIIGRDITYLKPAPPRWVKVNRQPFYKKMSVQILLAVPPILLLLISLITARREKLAGNRALARRQKAPKAARENIQRARQALRKKEDALFYEALWNALADYFGHRLNLAPGEITLATVQTHFPSQTEVLQTLFETIEHRRYAQGAASSDADKKELLKLLESTLRACERIKL